MESYAIEKCNFLITIINHSHRRRLRRRRVTRNLLAAVACLPISPMTSGEINYHRREEANRNENF